MVHMAQDGLYGEETVHNSENHYYTIIFIVCNEPHILMELYYLELGVIV